MITKSWKTDERTKNIKHKLRYGYKESIEVSGR